MKNNILATLMATICVSLSEFVPNTFLVRQKVGSKYENHRPYISRSTHKWSHLRNLLLMPCLGYLHIISQVLLVPNNLARLVREICFYVAGQWQSWSGATRDTTLCNTLEHNLSLCGLGDYYENLKKIKLGWSE